MMWIDRLGTNGWAAVLVVCVLGGGLALARLVGQAGNAERGLERDYQEMEIDTRVVVARVHAKTQATAELVAGNLTLLEAAAQFRAINQTRSAREWVGVRCYLQDEPEAVLACREVINWVAAELSMEDPCLGVALSSSFERQLAGHVRHGTLRLPDVSPGWMLAYER